MARSASMRPVADRPDLSGIYRLFWSKRSGMKIWLVDGAAVCRRIYPEFIFGGNEQRYRFNPPGDIWIDNRCSIEELEYTIAHELIERTVMAAERATYNDAHNLALRAEVVLRDRHYARRARQQAKIFSGLLTPPKAADGNRLEPAVFASFYRQPLRRCHGASVWTVDGSAVRRFFNPDFGFATCDVYDGRVPEGQIWIDAAVSAEEAYYALYQHRTMRRLVRQGKDASAAYDASLELVLRERQRQDELCRRHEIALPVVDFGANDRGYGKDRNPFDD